MDYKKNTFLLILMYKHYKIYKIYTKKILHIQKKTLYTKKNLYTIQKKPYL